MLPGDLLGGLPPHPMVASTLPYVGLALHLVTSNCPPASTPYRFWRNPTGTLNSHLAYVKSSLSSDFLSHLDLDEFTSVFFLYYLFLSVAFLSRQEYYIFSRFMAMI